MPRRKPATGQNKEMQAKIAAKFGKTSSRTGGRGSMRRKFKAPPKSSMQDDKRLQGQLKKLNVNPIPAIEEVNLFKEDGTVVHFTKPKVQAEISSNTYVISGQCETKKLEELIPQILPQLGREHIDSLKNFANAFGAGGIGPDADADDDVPVLVDDNFEAVASSDQKNETTDDNAANATDANGNDNNDNNDATDNNDADTTADADADNGDKAANNDNTNETTDNNDGKQESGNADDANTEDNNPTSMKPDPNAEASV